MEIEGHAFFAGEITSSFGEETLMPRTKAAPTIPPLQARIGTGLVHVRLYGPHNRHAMPVISQEIPQSLFPTEPQSCILEDDRT
jgi:hypothetical protein